LSGPTHPQVPPAGTINLDHVAHFVPDRAACLAGLQQLGFSPTPFSVQYNTLRPGEPLTPAGTGNHCVMLQAGYLEFLVPIADTALAAQLQSAIARYVGAHSIVFGSADAAQDHERLARAGFAPSTPIALQRPIGTPAGTATARFTVVRVAPGAMAEGRIQYCQHHTPELVWQPRWTEHRNGAVALRAAILCVADAAEAAHRYARFTGVRSEAQGRTHVLRLERGRIEIHDEHSFNDAFGVSPPALPSIAGCELESSDLARTRDVLAQADLPVDRHPDGRLVACAPGAVGGVFIFR
jgi:hypothetical protein